MRMRHPDGILNGPVDPKLVELVGDLHGATPLLKEIVITLKSFPNIEVLCLTAAPPPASHLSPPPFTDETPHVVLPRLWSLTFRGSSKTARRFILPLHLPVLEEFHLENTLPY